MLRGLTRLQRLSKVSPLALRLLIPEPLAHPAFLLTRERLAWSRVLPKENPNNLRWGMTHWHGQPKTA